MALKAALLGNAALASLAWAAQPGAVKPVAAPMRDLQWGQINFLHTTDTHGWHGGHLQESQYSADWGDYVSFAEHLRKRADDEGVDLLLVDTGDRVEGNGLYDGSDPKGEYTYDIHRQQAIDIICTGNHELYQADAADRERQQMVPDYKNAYVASNLDYVDPETGDRSPMAQRYRKFRTKNQKLSVVAFGFLFDFTGNANNTVVQPVEDTIKEQWFQDAIREKPDLFVVAGHVGIRMDEFKDIFTAIRKQNWFTPIAFFGGHVHVRDAASYDSMAFAIASGRYFETIGWMSIDGIRRSSDEKQADEVSAADAVSFQRRYMDNNLLGMYHHTGLNETTFPTEHGRNVSHMIAEARRALDLDKPHGCAPQDYWMSRSEYPSNASIYTLLEEKVLPNITVNEDRRHLPRLAIVNTGAIRFDIFKGAFTRDTTFIVSPFTSGLNYVQDVPYDVAKKVITLLNNGGQILGEKSVDPMYMGLPELRTGGRRPDGPASSIPLPDDGIREQIPLLMSGGGGGGPGHGKPDLVGGYTTKDDVGGDGDDAVHSAIKFYAVPNCIQSEVAFPPEGDPEAVDLVFMDFIQPWVMLALKFSGGDYKEEDVGVYANGTFTEMFSQWVRENWTGDC